MEGRRNARRWRLRRCYQRSRLEEQLWATAYEEIWPVIRRSLAQQRRNEGEAVGQAVDSPRPIARRA